METTNKTEFDVKGIIERLSKELGRNSKPSLYVINRITFEYHKVAVFKKLGDALSVADILNTHYKNDKTICYLVK